jgi:hypothetical protein
VKNDIVSEALEAAKKEFVTGAKKKENLRLIGEILEYLNNTICEHVISGSVTLRLEVSECKIHTYKISELKKFSIDESCYEGDVE